MLQELWCTGFVVPGQVETSRDRARVPYTGRQILNLWATREVLETFLIVTTGEGDRLICS